MEDFTPITSQEALENVLKDRLNRQNEKHSKEIAELKAQFSDYDELKASKEGFDARITDLETQLQEAQTLLSGYGTQIAEKDKQIEGYKLTALRTQIASEMGLSSEAIEFLHGATEEEIRGSAEKLTKLAPKKVAPTFTQNGSESDARTTALKEMLTNLNI